ncbi:MAG TPA: AraC family transcriptional regulator [Microbacteriaceae bacterium]|nr:AraC family transcriptional regulator [Microbacteriaceae bacterium]
MLHVVSQRADEWEAASARAVVPLRADAMPADFRGSLLRQDFADGVWAVRTHSSPHTLARTASLIDSSASDGVLLEIDVSGTTRVRQSGREVVVGPGQAVFYDTRVPYSLSFPGDNVSYLLHVPIELLEVAPGRVGELTARGIGERDAGVRLLDGYLRLVFGLEAPAPELVEPITRTLTELAGVIARSATDASPPRAAGSLVVALQATARRHLANPELSPESLARHHHVSVRGVYAAFAGVGLAPAAWIRAQRVERARGLLRRTSMRVDDVALAVGFRETSTFTRAFRRDAGMSPGEFRLRAAGESRG